MHNKTPYIRLLFYQLKIQLNNGGLECRNTQWCCDLQFVLSGNLMYRVTGLWYKATVQDQEGMPEICIWIPVSTKTTH